MFQILRRYRRWLVGIGLFLGVVGVVWLGCSWLAPEPGSSEDVFARVQIGMNQEEAVAVLRSYSPDTTEGHYSTGTTKDGRSLDRFHPERPAFESLPSPDEIEYCVLTVDDKDGRMVEIILSRGGTVSGKRLSPGIWEYRVDKVHRAIARVRYDLLGRSWWEDQLHKVHRSLRRNGITSRWVWLLGLVLLAVWTLRRGKTRRRLGQTQSGQKKVSGTDIATHVVRNIDS